MNLEWEKLTETIAYNGYRKIKRTQFRLPDGRTDDFDIIFEGTVTCVLALTPAKEIILAQQYRPGPEKVLYELPGAYVNSNETPEQAATRELREETGYEGTLTFVGTSIQSAYSSMLRYNFVATNCHKVSEPSPDPNEFITPTLMSLEQFRTFLKTGELSDISTAYLGLDFLGLL